MGSVDDYASGFSGEVKERLDRVISLVRELVPEAIEKISYGIPTWHWKENLVHVAAYEKHVGWYPTSSAIEAFKEELTSYKFAKGSVQFPHNKPLPLDLIRRMTLFRLSQVSGA